MEGQQGGGRSGETFHPLARRHPHRDVHTGTHRMGVPDHPPPLFLLSNKIYDLVHKKAGAVMVGDGDGDDDHDDGDVETERQDNSQNAIQHTHNTVHSATQRLSRDSQADKKKREAKRG